MRSAPESFVTSIGAITPVNEPACGGVPGSVLVVSASLTSRPGVPRPVLAVLVALVVEALLLFVVAGFFVYAVVTDRAADIGFDLAAAVFCLLVLGVLLACARALHQGQRWARAPVVTVQLLTLFALAVPALQGGRWWVGAVLLVLSLVAGLGLFAPSALQHTEGRGGAPVA